MPDPYIVGASWMIATWLIGATICVVFVWAIEKVTKWKKR